MLPISAHAERLISHAARREVSLSVSSRPSHAVSRWLPAAQGTNDFVAAHADAGLYCGIAYAPLVANRSGATPSSSLRLVASIQLATSSPYRVTWSSFARNAERDPH